MHNFQFDPADQQLLDAHVSIRDNETRIGQNCFLGLDNPAQYAILGINEDIGPQTNLGRPGSTEAFSCFAGKFLNMQSNKFVHGKEITIYGQINQSVNFTNPEKGKLLVEELDNIVKEHIAQIIKAGKTPIVIGGGHNNALPIIEACFSVRQKALDVINLDPHADTRALEGRHSGNSFSYGIHNKWINQYAVLGLHKAYNSTFILDFLEENNCTYTFFEDYLMGNSSLVEDVKNYCEINHATSLGIELDMDSISFMPSSAMGPSGWKLEDARKYILELKHSKRKISYLHLPEAAPTTSEEKLIVGKALAYLIHDFIHA